MKSMKWLPLPKIAHGIVIYPFSPSAIRPQLESNENSSNERRPLSVSSSSQTAYDDASLGADTSTSSNYFDSQKNLRKSSNMDDHRQLRRLEVGDDVYIFEQLGEWCRGYVCTMLEEGRKPNRAPIGCFPLSHIHIKEYLEIDTNKSDTMHHNQHSFNQDVWSYFNSKSKIPNLTRSFSESHIDTRNPPRMNLLVRTGSLTDLNKEPAAFPELDNSIYDRSSTTHGPPPPPLPKSCLDQSTLAGYAEPLIDEIASCVTEWNNLFYTSLSKGDYKTFRYLKDNVNYLLQSRKQLLNRSLSKDENLRLRKETIQRMIAVNMNLHKDIMVRHPEIGYLLDIKNTPLSTIYQFHWKYATSGTENFDNEKLAPVRCSADDSSGKPEASPHLNTAKFYHIFMSLNTVVAQIGLPGEFMELHFSLYSSISRKFFTEEYIVVLNHDGIPRDAGQVNKLKALYVDLSSRDVSDGLYLVCHIFRLGSLKMNDNSFYHYFGNFNNNFLHVNRKNALSHPSNTLCKRPFGCALLKLTLSDFQKEPVQFDMPIYTPTGESSFTKLHENIINNSSKDAFKKVPQADKLVVLLQSFYGVIKDVVHTNKRLLQNATHTLRIGFADVSFPNDSRNELYIRLNEGDFSQFGRSRNIQVSMCVRDNETGEIIDNAISVGAGKEAVTHWESMIIYHEKQPKWKEQIKIKIKDVGQWQRSHVFITVKHRSSHYGSGASSPSYKINGVYHKNAHGTENPIAMGFLPIFLPPSHRDMVADGTHAICLYKYDLQLSHPHYYLNGVQWCSESTAPLNMAAQQEETKTPKTLKQPHFGSSASSARSLRSSIGSLKSSGSLKTARSSMEVNPSMLYHSGSQTPTNKLVPLHDKVYLATFLCSTKFTQNQTLLKLLNWRALVQDSGNGRKELLSVLDQFSFVGEVEVVKFLTSIFDALLNIMVYHEDENESINREIHDQVLSAIVWLLGIVQDRRFSNFKPGLDTYLDHRFVTQPASGSDLDRIATSKYFISSLTRLCETPSEPSKAKLLRSSMKVWGYLFRFIVRSRLFHEKIEDAEERVKNNEAFNRGVDKLLVVITNIMSPDHPNSMIGTQTMALQNFPVVLGELQNIFPCEHVMDITVSFVDACAHVTGRLIGYKLMFVLNIVKGQIVEDPLFRTGMLKHVFRWVRVWIDCYMVTAKNIIFAKKTRQVARESTESTPQQNRLPKTQWIENLRISLTIMKELLNSVRKSTGMDSSGIPSPFMNDRSRPTSFCTAHSDKEESYLDNASPTIKGALDLVPQLLNAYRDLQRLVIQAIQISDSTEDSSNTEPGDESATNSRPHSRHSFGKFRERATSVNSRTPVSSEAVQEHQTAPQGRSSTSDIANSSAPNITIHAADHKAKFNIILQALATSPAIPFPSVYPFPPIVKSTITKESGSSSNQAAMVTTGLLDLTVVFLELFYLTPEKQWVSYIETMLRQEGLEATSEFLRRVVYTCMGILFGDNILVLEESTLFVDSMGQGDEDPSGARRRLPYQWLNLTAIAHKVVLTHILDPIKIILQLPEFMPSAIAYTKTEAEEEFSTKEALSREDLNEEEELEPSSSLLQKSNTTAAIGEQRSALLLWRVFFVGFLRVIDSPRLDVSEFKPQTQRALWELLRNTREEYGANTCLLLWNLAGKSSNVFSTAGQNDIQPDMEDNNNHNKHASHSMSDYFSLDNSSSFDYGYFTDANLGRKSTVSNDDMENMSLSSQNTSNYYNSQYPTRHSVRIAPTDEIPLQNVNEGKNVSHSVKIPFLQIDLAHFILGPIAAASLTLSDRVRKSALSIIADIIAIELYSFGELMYVQKTLIGTLDHAIMSDHRGDETTSLCIASESRQLLSQRLQRDHRDDLQPIGKRIFDSFSKYFNLLLQVRSLPVDDNEYLDERIMATLKLMKFIQVIEREEIYVKYVHQLVQVHLDNNSFIEAALTLRFHSDLLLWDTNDKLAAIPEMGFPIECSFERKERLYMTIIGYLDKGCAWEICVTFCKELAYEYEHTNFDYTKLTDILQRQAGFTDNINKEERCFTGYFRVGFYGRGFPSSNRNRQYIYRGLEWEKIDSFIERMQNRHPTAEILPSKMANSLSLTEEQLKEIESTSDGKYLQITPVTPVPDIQLVPCLSNPNAPENVRKFYEFNNVNKFVFTRVLTKEISDGGSSQPEADFCNLWTEKIELESEDRFPTIVKRSKIVKAHSTLVSPIENAIEVVEKKNRELVSLERKYDAYVPKNAHQETPSVNISPFSMSLNGAVDAPVNGGIPLYKKAFLSKEYWNTNPDMRHLITRLQEVIQDQVLVIQKCLETHGLLVSNDMQPFHSTLVEFFHKNFADEIKAMKERHSKEEKKEKHTSSIFTNRRISTLSSATDGNSVYSHYYQQSYDDPRPSLSQLSRQSTTFMMTQTPDAMPTMSPISRAFSIKTPNTENSPGTMNTENTSMHRTESLSRTLRMSLRRRARKKSVNMNNQQY